MDQQRQIWPVLWCCLMCLNLNVESVFKSNFKMQMHWLADSYLRKIGNFLVPCLFIFCKEWNIGQSFICWKLSSSVTQTQHWPKFFLLWSAEVENNEGSVVSQMQNLKLLECLQVQGLQFYCSIPYSKFLCRKIYLFARYSCTELDTLI